MNALYRCVVALLVASPGYAQELLLPRQSGEPAQWKAEVYHHSPSLGVTDLKPRQFEAWSALITCTANPERPKLDTCRFHNDRVYWAYALADDPSVVSYTLDLPLEIEVTWSSRGRVQSVDLRGDREAFYLEVSAAFADLRAGSGATNVRGTTGAQRQLGVYAEDELIAGIIGALEVELPKKGLIKEEGWKLSDSPRAARRYRGSTSSTQIKCKRTEGRDQLAFIACAGAFSEMSGDATASASTHYVETSVKRNAWFNVESGRIESGEMHTWTRSPNPLFGFTASSIYVTAWSTALTGPPSQRELPPPGVTPPESFGPPP